MTIYIKKIETSYLFLSWTKLNLKGNIVLVKCIKQYNYFLSKTQEIKARIGTQACTK